ncbi:MAG: membrane protein insertion efficiency factor YidD [Pseudomonadota bacterium]
MSFNPLYWLAIGLLRLYQLILSPILSYFGSNCRHTPTCSNYMLRAMRRHGFWAGGWMGLSRLLRCHPWGTMGHDPVPAETDGRWWKPWSYGRWR